MSRNHTTRTASTPTATTDLAGPGGIGEPTQLAARPLSREYRA
ncbi:hypothetical protein [Glycomyces rhizosphaerae]|uniref:Uncharacterized protein n=1 Tax=Glycomyces rhizosphaerae TaxID=2054422 RepID=A0ABV7PWL4_9ACTN